MMLCGDRLNSGHSYSFIRQVAEAVPEEPEKPHDPWLARLALVAVLPAYIIAAYSIFILENNHVLIAVFLALTTILGGVLGVKYGQKLVDAFGKG